MHLSPKLEYFLFMLSGEVAFIHFTTYLHNTLHLRGNYSSTLYSALAAAILSVYLITCCVQPIYDFRTVKPFFDEQWM